MSSIFNVQTWQILKLTERVNLLEEKTFKSKRKDTTRAQQMLLLKHLGILEILDNIPTKKAKAKLLSALLNADSDNIEDDLTNINRELSGISTKENYEYIIK